MTTIASTDNTFYFLPNTFGIVVGVKTPPTPLQSKHLEYQIRCSVLRGSKIHHSFKTGKRPDLSKSSAHLLTWVVYIILISWLILNCFSYKKSPSQVLSAKPVGLSSSVVKSL